LLLTWFGYAANQTQSVESVHGIILLMSIVPGVIGLLAAGSLLFYGLDESLMSRIAADLEIRRAQTAPVSTGA
jgi:GPH family glycoside/pentoside/hexuronide:cation symporter